MIISPPLSMLLKKDAECLTISRSSFFIFWLRYPLSMKYLISEHRASEYPPDRPCFQRLQWHLSLSTFSSRNLVDHHDHIRFSRHGSGDRNRHSRYHASSPSQRILSHGNPSNIVVENGGIHMGSPVRYDCLWTLGLSTLSRLFHISRLCFRRR